MTQIDEKALEAANARIAELERELEARKNYTDEDYIRLHNAHCCTANKLATATAHAERLDAALREAREQILILKNARWSEAEGSDAEWVGVIYAAQEKKP